jgi:hypothetical protein
MPHGSDRNDALVFALLADAAGEAPVVQFAEARMDPVTVPRPQAWDTVTIAVITGRPLKLEFSVNDVKTREVVRDDLVLGFENGGKVVLKDYMHAFGMLGEQRTTIIQPDGKHYAFTELLSPTAGPRAETPAKTTPDVVIIQKPPAGETQSLKLSPDKPMALNFGMGDVARSQVKDGNLVLTFKDKSVLVLEGYSALKDSADISLYFAKGDKISLADLAPGAGPADPGAEGGHLFTQFAPGGTLGPLAHLGPLGPDPFDLIPPPGPPESPPPTTPPPQIPPPPPPVNCIPPPPKDCEPPPKDCDPPPPPVKDCEPPPVCEPKVVICEPPAKECASDPKDHGDRGGSERVDHGKLTWVTAPGCEIGGDAHGSGGRWGEGARADHGGRHDLHADGAHRGWVNGHDDGGAANVVQQAHHRDAQPVDGTQGAWTHHADAGADGTYGWQSHLGQQTALHGKHVGENGWSSDHAHWSGGNRDDGQHGHSDHAQGREGHHPAISSHDVFDTGGSDAPAHAGDRGGSQFAAAHDFAAVTAHAENHAPQIQNHAQHNVMGHG